MEPEFKLLIVDDNPDDAELILHQFFKTGIKLVTKVVADKYSYELALNTFLPDVVYCDFNVSVDFTAVEAVRLLKNKFSDVPFVLVTGSLSEEAVSVCLTEGMDDYLLKDNISRLPVSLINALGKRELQHEKKKVLKELVEREKELSAFFESVDEVFFSWDAVHPRIIQINSACEQLYGYPKKSFYDNPNLLIDVIHPDDREKVADGYYKLNHKSVFQHRIVLSNGVIRWVESVLTPTINLYGNLARIDGMITDITAEKEAEVLAKERQLIDLRNQFVSIASHEFKTPLTAIQFAVSNIERSLGDTISDPVMSKLAQIKRNLSQMNELMDDILTLGKLDTEVEGLSYNEINLNTFIRKIVEEVQISLTATHEIRASVNAASPMIKSSEKLLRNIFINLLTNAIKYSPGQKYVSFVITEEGDKTVFKIIDYGMGIDAQERVSIFDPFRRGINVKGIQGTGLGLFIVKRAVELLKGEINLETRIGEGSTFTVTLSFKSSIGK